MRRSAASARGSVFVQIPRESPRGSWLRGVRSVTWREKTEETGMFMPVCTGTPEFMWQCPGEAQGIIICTILSFPEIMSMMCLPAVSGSISRRILSMTFTIPMWWCGATGSSAPEAMESLWQIVFLRWLMETGAWMQEPWETWKRPGWLQESGSAPPQMPWFREMKCPAPDSLKMTALPLIRTGELPEPPFFSIAIPMTIRAVSGWIVRGLTGI